MQAATTLNDNQQQLVTVATVDKKGNVDPNDTTTVSWSSGDTSIVTVSPQPTPADGSKALLVAQKPGQTTVTASRGNFTLAIGVTVTASADTGLAATFDTPADQPAPTP